MFAIKAPVTVSVVASAQAQKSEKKATKPQQIAAAGAAAIVLFNSAPANAEIMGLTLQNGVPNAAAQKFVQPFVPDGRPVVYVEKDGSADITTFDGRLAANVARSNVGCKTITGAPQVNVFILRSMRE
ncbi:unnamed protein product [Bathycoccus prasinos]